MDTIADSINLNGNDNDILERFVRALRKKNINLRVAFTPQVNIFQNKASIQLIIRDFNILSTTPPKEETDQE